MPAPRPDRPRHFAAILWRTLQRAASALRPAPGGFRPHRYSPLARFLLMILIAKQYVYE